MAETTEFGPRKTVFILAIVAGCFAVLWPKVFYPMLSTSVAPRHPASDASTCCDVIFESDVNVVDILQEMCRNILKHHEFDPRVRDALSTDRLTAQGASYCREEVLRRCGIDLSTFLAEKEKLGKSHKQVLEEIRSSNGSLCLKNNFGVPLSQLGTPHHIRYHILMPHNPIRQERRTPSHAGGLHPALRERGRAIPSSHIVPKIKDRPDHVNIPKTRPTIGGAGHVVPPPKGGGGMGLIMPLYTLGIVLFFLYTISKVLRKSADNEIRSEYVGEAAEREFQRIVFSPETFLAAFTGGMEKRPKVDNSRIPTLEELQEQAAGNIEIDQLRRRLVETEAAMERIVVQMNLQRSARSTSPQPESKAELPKEPCCESGNLEPELDELTPRVKVLGMETTASSEDGHRVRSRPSTPVPTLHIPEREKSPPKMIYLEGELPPQCELLVSDSEIRTEQSEDEEEEGPIVLAGKMTLSLISLEQETNNETDSTKMNGTANSSDSEDNDDYKDSSEDLTTEHRMVDNRLGDDDDSSGKSCYEDDVVEDSLLDRDGDEKILYHKDVPLEE